MSSAIRLVNPELGADCEIFMKARNNDTDLIGHILRGLNNQRVNPTFKIDANLMQLLQDLQKCQTLQMQVEMI